ncbi:hypothetical protein JXR93_10405 [bacterium]|nr:hypothetical protein [bacterium]
MKKIVIITYILLIALFGFFYEDKSELKASNEDFNTKMTMFYDFDVPHYPGVAEYPITNSSYVNNARSQSSYFLTNDNPIHIGNFYIDYWESKGLKVFSEFYPTGGNLSVYDLKEETVKNIIIQPYDKNQFMVMVTVIKSDMMKREMNAFSDVPVYKNSYGFVSYESEESYYIAATTTYMNPHSFKENFEFYSQTPQKKGWRFIKELKVDKIEFSKTLMFDKGEKDMEINLTEMDGGTSVNVVVRDKKRSLIKEEVR